MFDDLKRLASLGDDPQQFAQGLQQLASGGGFDPLRLITGVPQVWAVFLAPLTPALLRAVARLERSGDGPLAATVAQAQEQLGCDAETARARVVQTFAAARGCVVLVLASESGLQAVPHLVHGPLDAAWRDQVRSSLGERFPDRDRVDALLAQVSERAGLGFPRAVAGWNGEAHAFWTEAAERLLSGVDEGLLASRDSLSDLAWWIAAALVEHLHQPNEGEAWLTVARLAALGGDAQAAVACLQRLMADYEVEAEDLVPVVEHLVESAVRQRRAVEVRDLCHDLWPALDQACGGPCFELARARLRLCAAALSSAETLVAAAEALAAADRKAFRHELAREPLWVSGVDEPGELLDTAAAAERIGRSPAFVAKRLEQGTLPVHHDGKELRIPLAGLTGWQAVMQHFRVLEGP